VEDLQEVAEGRPKFLKDLGAVSIHNHIGDLVTHKSSPFERKKRARD
jgi:hypothetical protein